jgi:hypothetical protein
MIMSSKLRSIGNETKLRLLMPVDSLTRLMMDADGVSVFEMEALMQRIGRALAQRSDSREGASGWPQRCLDGTVPSIGA